MKPDWLDEVIIGIGIVAISVAAIFKLGEAAAPLCTAAIGALGAYLGAKNGRGGKT